MKGWCLITIGFFLEEDELGLEESRAGFELGFIVVLLDLFVGCKLVVIGWNIQRLSNPRVFFLRFEINRRGYSGTGDELANQFSNDLMRWVGVVCWRCI